MILKKSHNFISIQILMEYCYNGNPIYSQVVKSNICTEGYKSQLVS